jgi:hypothetical protein
VRRRMYHIKWRLPLSDRRDLFEAARVESANSLRDRGADLSLFGLSELLHHGLGYRRPFDRGALRVSHHVHRHHVARPLQRSQLFPELFASSPPANSGYPGLRERAKPTRRLGFGGGRVLRQPDFVGYAAGLRPT